MQLRSLLSLASLVAVAVAAPPNQGLDVTTVTIKPLETKTVKADAQLIAPVSETKIVSHTLLAVTSVTVNNPPVTITLW
ncbi:hypothetical protein C8Q76DRAFT_803540 [Earliella scabrosa]|nr:hypothetical protein C8Q76DRAFT_803540 [Earliella scabrosa]